MNQAMDSIGVVNSYLAGECDVDLHVNAALADLMVRLDKLKANPMFADVEFSPDVMALLERMPIPVEC